MKYLSIIIILVTVAACSSTEKAVNDTVNTIKENIDSEDKRYAAKLDLEKFRTQLSDAYAYRENEIPEAFNRIRVEQKQERNIYEGYRIQIYSGSNVTTADTLARNFRAWSDTTIVGYQANTYVFFRAPYYRVHVGDFHERERAITYSNIVKRYFKDAWVVYDRVNPRNVPADTVVIQTQ